MMPSAIPASFPSRRQSRKVLLNASRSDSIAAKSVRALIRLLQC
jgi:hypothetical protein